MYNVKILYQEMEREFGDLGRRYQEVRRRGDGGRDIGIDR